MKKFILLAAACMFSAAAMSQVEKTEAAENPAADHPAGHECYMMKSKALMHCNGKSAEAQNTDVKLENGMVITRSGNIIKTNGEKVMMKDGQCIDLSGMVGDCAEMHKAMMEGSEKEGADKM